MKSTTGPRIATIAAVLTMAIAGIGVVVSVILNAFVFDEYDAYGQVSIPGSSRMQLPAGDTTVTFHTVLVGGSGSGLPVPPLKYRITGPGGVDAQLTEDYGSTTTVNNDARVRIGYLHVPAGGAYDVELNGNVSAYLDPTLAFGHGTRYGYLPWVFAAVFGLAVVDLIVVRIWAARSRERAQVASTWSGTDDVPPPIRSVPTGQGIRIEQLNNLVRLRDSGALTDDEFEAEKKRVLDEL